MSTTPPHVSNTSLYVGDLENDVFETQLFEIFSQAGPVASIRVCRDAVTRRSLGYAYINFHKPEDAERALDLLNYKEIKGRPCRIMWSQRDPQLRKTNQGNIFIKNLHKSIDNKALHDTFSSFGKILSCKVATDERGNSRGYGFIHYETQEAADKACIVNGKLLEGKKCFVGPFVPRKTRTNDQGDSNWTNIYVKNLSTSMDEQQLREMFGKYGTITSAAISKDDKGSSKGFAFINFQSNEEAQKAVDELNGKETTDGKQLYVGRAQKKSEREKELKDMFQKIQHERSSKYQGVNLYVKNLDTAVDDETLRREFSQSGTITSAKVMMDDKNTSMGFGFVCYSTPEEATKAVTEMNGRLINGKPIYVALAQKKDQRRAQLEQQYARAQNQRMPPMMPGAPMFAPPMFIGRGGYMYPPNAAQPMRGGRYPNPQARGSPMANQGNAASGAQPGAQGGNGRGKGRGRGGQASGTQMNIKYNQNVRNQQTTAESPSANEIPTAGMTAEQRTRLGEQLYPLIMNILTTFSRQDYAGKITGMILESMDQPELIHLIKSNDALQDKVKEAMEVLSIHANAEDKQHKGNDGGSSD